MPGIDGVGGIGIDTLSLYRQLPQYAALEQPTGVGGRPALPGAAATGGPEQAGFAQMIGDKLHAAVELQGQGSAAAQALATGQASDISAATIAVQKANIALQLVGAFRNKAVEAYQDVMRMQI